MEQVRIRGDIRAERKAGEGRLGMKKVACPLSCLLSIIALHLNIGSEKD